MYYFAHFSILARSEFANSSASDGVLSFVMIPRSSAKAITFVWLEMSKFKRALYMMFRNLRAAFRHCVCVCVFVCGCVCGCVWVCGFCNVWVCVCVGFVMCGCVYVWVL